MDVFRFGVEVKGVDWGGIGSKSVLDKEGAEELVTGFWGV
jgi:hypothetical protein